MMMLSNSLGSIGAMVSVCDNSLVSTDFPFWVEHGDILVAIGLAFVVLISAEITPKTVAAIYAEKTARLVAYPIHIILKILYPVVWFANIITNGFLRLFRIRVANHSIEPLS